MTYTPHPDTKDSVVVTKSFTYRGLTRLFTNRYNFDDGLPADPSHWDTFMDAIVAAEKTCYYSDVEIVLVTGHDHSSATTKNLHGDAVHSKVYTTAGTFAPAVGDDKAPGDSAAMLRFATSVRNVVNRPIYLFKYLHGVYHTGDGDTISPTQKTAIETYGQDWITGFSDGSVTHHVCGPQGETVTGKRCDPYVRHRDFPA